MCSNENHIIIIRQMHISAVIVMFFDRDDPMHKLYIGHCLLNSKYKTLSFKWYYDETRAQYLLYAT